MFPKKLELKIHIISETTSRKRHLSQKKKKKKYSALEH